MKPSFQAFRLALGAVLALALTLPSYAQTRHRMVSRASTDPATLSGVVVDAVTRAPLAEAIVKVGNKAVGTVADGKFSVSGLSANSFTVRATRWGYSDYEQVVKLNPGANTLEIAMQPGPIVNVKAKNGTTYPLDYASLQFGYVVAFVGWRSYPEFHLCLATGDEKVVKNEEMKSVTFPGTRSESTSCCSLAPGTVARITTKEGALVDATIRESCNGSEFFVLGRNRSNGNYESIKLSEVESVTFP